MKTLMKVTLACFGILVTTTTLRAQDPEFTQFYSNPLYLNPALAGDKICPRVGINYRVQWPNVYGTYTTLGASFDKLVHGLKGGVGVTVVHDRAAQGSLNTTGIGVVYAPKIRLGRHTYVSVGMQAGWWQKAVNWSMLTFGDQIDAQNGFVNNTSETAPADATQGDFDLASGIVLTTKNIFIGGAVHHILQQNESFLNGTSPLPRKYTVHAGGIIPLSKNSHEGETYISPNVMYRQQGNFRQLNLGLYFKKERIVGGLWYRGNDSFIMLLGVEAGAMRIGYSYDVTVSKLTNATAGSHEISLGYQFTCKTPSKKYRPGICPSW
jgi:type IX secretion system PorP/SprF family membrane protein